MTCEHLWFKVDPKLAAKVLKPLFTAYGWGERYLMTGQEALLGSYLKEVP